MFFSLILACTFNGGIGNDNLIPWNIKEEMLLFKKITSEVNCYVKKNAVIMGKNTWDSLPKKPLDNRINIILTSKPELINQNDSNIFAFKSLDEGLDFCEKTIHVNKIFIIGGKKLYDLCLNNHKYLNKIEHIHLSLIKDNYNCDTFIDLKKILKNFNKYHINDVIFNSNFIYVKYIK